MDAQSSGNIFDSIEPHRHLPDETRAALWSACKLVQMHPGEFADAVAWLDGEYSEAAWRDRELKTTELTYRRELRDVIGGCRRFDTFRRRRALRHGTSRETLALQTIEDASGMIIRGDEILGTNNRQDGDVPVGAENVEIAWRSTDQKCRQSIQRVKNERRKRIARIFKEAKGPMARFYDAVRDAVDGDIPAVNRLECSRRLVLLAAVIASPDPISLSAEFVDLPWTRKESPGSFWFQKLDFLKGATQWQIAGIQADSFGNLIARALGVLNCEGATVVAGNEQKADAPQLKGELGGNSATAVAASPPAAAGADPTKASTTMPKPPNENAGKPSTDRLGYRLISPPESQHFLSIEYGCGTPSEACGTLSKIQEELRGVQKRRERILNPSADIDKHDVYFELGIALVPLPDGMVVLPQLCLAHLQHRRADYVLTHAAKNGWLGSVKPGEWMDTELVCHGPSGETEPLHVNLVNDEKERGIPIEATDFFDAVYQWVFNWCREVTTDPPPGDQYGQWIWALGVCAKKVMAATSAKTAIPTAPPDPKFAPNPPTAATPAPPSAAAPQVQEERFAFRKTGNVWEIRFDGESGSFSDAKGFQHIHRLLQSPGMAVSALEMMRVDVSKIVMSADGGGETMDDEAIADAKRRIDELQTKMDDTVDDVAKSALEEEKQEIAAELIKASAPNGKARILQKTPGDKAANAVRNAIERAIKMLDMSEGKMPRFVQHLRQEIETGQECIYKNVDLGWSI